MLSNSKARRILVIGLDSAPWKLLRSWLISGKLPNLSRMYYGGVAGPLISVPPYESPVAWSSILTGKNPGKHGIFGFLRRREDSYETEAVNSTHRRAQDIAQLLSRQGYTSILINVPITYPPPSIKGAVVSGYGGPEGDDRARSNPRSLWDEFKTDIGLLPPRGIFFNPFRPNEYLEYLKRRISFTYNLARYVMGKFDWDLFMVVFFETDSIQHYLWESIESSWSPDSKPSNLGLRTPIFDLYKYVDGLIGSLQRSAPADTLLMIVSDHGARLAKRALHLNEILAHEGLLRFRGTGILRQAQRWIVFNQKTVYSIATNLRLASFKDKFFATTSQSERVDWSNTHAYNLPGVKGIFINLKGREADGHVEKTHRQEVAKFVIKRLENFVPGGLRASLREQVYWGPYIEEAPDIVCVALRPYLIMNEYFSYGTPVSDPVWSGAHDEEGVILMSGPGIKQGVEIQANCMDVMPTILCLLGCPIPSSVDGKVMTEALDARVAASAIFSDEDREQTVIPSRLAPNDEAEVLKRLRELGYL